MSREGGALPLWAVFAGLAGLGLWTAAGLPMQEQRLPIWAAVMLLSGLVLWAFVVVRFPPAREAPESLEAPGPRPRLFLLVLSVALAIIAWRNTAAGVYRLAGVAPWIGSAASWLAAWSPVRRRAPRADPAERDGISGPVRIAVLAAILAVGAVFLFYRLSETPGDPYSDHAEKLLDVLDLQNGQRPIFFVRNTGREPFQFYWTFALMQLFGLPLRYLTLKIGTAAIGFLALPALYLLGREMGGTRLGLAVAALAAWSKWPVSLARNGLRYTLAVLPTVVVLWALFRYLRRGDRASILWAGIAVGIGLHGYSTFRVVPLLILLVFVFALIDGRRRGRRWPVVLDGLIVAGTAFVVSLPLVHYTIQHADQLWYRAATRVGSVEQPVGPQPLAIFARNVWNMILAFNWKGSSSWALIKIGEPFLDAVTAAFLLGGGVLLVALVARRSLRWAILPVAFFVLTLSSTLSLAFPIENPSINRAGTAIPVVFLVAALPVVHLLSAKRGAPIRVAAAGLAGLMLFSIERNARQYFVGFDRQYAQRMDHATEMAEVLDGYRRRGVPLRNMYLLYTDYWVDGRTIGLELGDPYWADSHIIPPGEVPRGLRERPLVFLHTPGAPVVEELEKTYPGTDRLVPQDFPDRNFSVYFVP